MRCFINLAVNVILGGLAGFGIADALPPHGMAPLIYECSGLIGGVLAGMAGCL